MRKETPMENNNQTNTANLESSPMPMKWHKFLIYCGLWLGGVGNALTGLGLVTGSAYTSAGVTAEQVYSVFPTLKPVDVILGLVSIAIGVMLIVVRFDLARFKRNGPKKLLILYGVSAVFTLAYPLLASAMTGMSFTDLWDPATIVGSILGVVINKIYYDKRGQLFIN